MEEESGASAEIKTLTNLRVVDLKQELEKRGLSKSGSKKDLVKRLKQQLEFEKLCGERKSGDCETKLQLDADTEQNEFVREYLAQQQRIIAEQKEVKRRIELEEHHESGDENESCDSAPSDPEIQSSQISSNEIESKAEQSSLTSREGTESTLDEKNFISKEEKTSHDDDKTSSESSESEDEKCTNNSDAVTADSSIDLSVHEEIEEVNSNGVKPSHHVSEVKIVPESSNEESISSLENRTSDTKEKESIKEVESNITAEQETEDNSKDNSSDNESVTQEIALKESDDKEKIVLETKNVVDITDATPVSHKEKEQSHENESIGQVNQVHVDQTNTSSILQSSDSESTDQESKHSLDQMEVNLTSSAKKSHENKNIEEENIVLLMQKDISVTSSEDDPHKRENMEDKNKTSLDQKNASPTSSRKRPHKNEYIEEENKGSLDERSDSPTPKGKRPHKDKSIEEESRTSQDKRNFSPTPSKKICKHESIEEESENSMDQASVNTLSPSKSVKDESVEMESENFVDQKSNNKSSTLPVETLHTEEVIEHKSKRHKDKIILKTSPTLRKYPHDSEDIEMANMPAKDKIDEIQTHSKKRSHTREIITYESKSSDKIDTSPTFSKKISSKRENREQESEHSMNRKLDKSSISFVDKDLKPKNTSPDNRPIREPVESKNMELKENTEISSCNTKYVSRKIQLSSRRESSKSGDEPAIKKTKWGSLNGARKNPAISISSDSIKNWFPDLKIMKDPVPELVAEEEVPITKQELSEIEKIDNISLDAPESESVPLSEEAEEVSCTLFIQNLVRPFTLNQLKELLKESGHFTDDRFWIDKIKSKCFVTYDTEAEALQTKRTLNGCRWPSSNPKVLLVEFSTSEEMEQQKRVGLVEVKKERRKEVLPIREWDKDKIRQDTPPFSSPPKHADRKEKKESKRRVPEETPAKLLDDLFQKTKNTPCIYWLPLTDELIVAREERRRQRRQREEQEENRRPKERSKGDGRRSSSPRRR